MAREINQQAIADRLNISRATVSRCFTGHAGISPVTRAKVFQVAAELGYTHMETRTPSAKKKSRSGAHFTVLICSEPDEYFHGAYQSPGEQIMAGVSEYAQVHQARVDVHIIPPQVRSIGNPAFDGIEGLSKRGKSGVLLIYPFPKPIVSELSLKFPLVSLVDQADYSNFDCVDVDHSGGIAMVVDHLVAAGHQRIGFYTRDYPVEASWSFRRYSAFVEKMARLELKVSPDDIIGMFPQRKYEVERSIDEAARRTSLGVTAWICAADHQAFDLVNGLRARGVRVPEDVSVTGFDGLARSPELPNLTTVEIPFRDIGMTGAERLASRLNRRFHGRRHVSVMGNLREGETVGPPRSNPQPIAVSG
ncbi:MAG: LacI family DNA-binding transcriptional regulator [Verrucomicrobiota bacterium JB023]|nr:LacI family DNA-binding transcriptional regulator [Verrucomicrobiota bacterium JB023]